MTTRHDDTNQDAGEPYLGPADARAVDRWMDGQPAQSACDLRVADLLSLLNAQSAISADSTLTDLTMVRILRATGSQASVEDAQATPQLAPLDAEALDAWLLAASGPRGSNRWPTW